MRPYTRAFMLVLGAALVTVVALSAQAAARALIFTPGSYDFGPVAVGQSVSTEFVLSYTGKGSSDTVTVTLMPKSTRTYTAPFTITANGCRGKSLTAKATCTVTVSYSPSAAGATDTGTLRATSQDQPLRSNSVTMTGSGATGPPSGCTLGSDDEDFNAAAGGTPATFGDPGAGTVSYGIGGQIVVAGNGGTDPWTPSPWPWTSQFTAGDQGLWSGMPDSTTLTASITFTFDEPLGMVIAGAVVQDSGYLTQMTARDSSGNLVVSGDNPRTLASDGTLGPIIAGGSANTIKTVTLTTTAPHGFVVPYISWACMGPPGPPDGS